MISKNLKTLFLILYFLLIPSLFIACADNFDKSDQNLIETFKNNQGEFEKLLEMLKKDTNLIRVDPRFTWREDKDNLISYEGDTSFSEERWNEYRELFAKLKLKRGLIRYKAPEFIFFFNGENKGIAYCDCDLSPLYESLDEINSASLTSSHALYRKIEKGWYVYYQPAE